MLGVLFGDAEPEHVAVEALRGFLVGDPEKNMADACQLDHRKLSAPEPIEAPC